MIALPLALLAAVALAMVVGDQGAASVLRHLYLVPTLWAALTRGAIGGGVVGALAGLLHAPVALPAVERAGLTSQTLDGLLSLGLPIVAGLLVGRLVDGSRARAARLAAVLAIQRRLDGPEALDDKLAGVARELRVALRARRLVLLVGADVRTALLASVPVGTLVDPDSAAAFALTTGQRVSIADLAADPRMRTDEPISSTPVRARERMER